MEGQHPACALCRSVEIPARLVLGQAFESPPPSEEACDLCGYQCTAHQLQFRPSRPTVVLARQPRFLFQACSIQGRTPALGRRDNAPRDRFSVQIERGVRCGEPSRRPFNQGVPGSIPGRLTKSGPYNTIRGGDKIRCLSQALPRLPQISDAQLLSRRAAVRTRHEGRSRRLSRTLRPWARDSQERPT